MPLWDVSQKENAVSVNEKRVEGEICGGKEEKKKCAQR